MPSIGRNPKLMPYGPEQEDYEYDGKVGKDMDLQRQKQFIEDTRLAARDALAIIITTYDTLTDYERMILPERFRIAIEIGRMA